MIFTVSFGRRQHNGKMPGMWGRQSRVLDLLRRTAKESWEDGVYGQASRLAFYHFIAIFPALLLVLILLAHLASEGAGMRRLLTESLQRLLPSQAALLVGGAIRDLEPNAHANGGLLLLAIASAIWAGHNASWAMIVGLNTAYETTEDRPWWSVLRAAVLLALGLLLLILAGLLAAQLAGRFLENVRPPGFVLETLEWCAIVVVVLLAFTIFYRFGPNLKRREWRWSIPGAAFGSVLWFASTLLLREYFDHISNYQRLYGRAAAAAMLLMWLYITGAAVLIGAELNSEIEKNRERSGKAPPERLGRNTRSGLTPGVRDSSRSPR